MPLQYSYQRPDILGNYSESEFTQFSSHSTRPIIEPKKEKIKDLGANYLLEVKHNNASVTMCTGYSVLKNPSDQNLSPAKTAQPSSLMPLKCLPKGIGYAEAINAGKSRYIFLFGFKCILFCCTTGNSIRHNKIPHYLTLFCLDIYGILKSA